MVAYAKNTWLLSLTLAATLAVTGCGDMGKRSSGGAAGGSTAAPAVTLPTGLLWVTTQGASGDILVDGQVVGQGAWSGQVAAGSHTVSFGAVAGYTLPAAQQVIVASRQVAVVSGLYSASTAVPPVTTTPPAAGQGTVSVTTTGAQGEIFINGQSAGIGQASMNLAAGVYPVSFSDINEFETPAIQTATVTAGQTAVVTGDYLRLADVPAEILMNTTAGTVRAQVAIDAQGRSYAAYKVISGDLVVQEFTGGVAGAAVTVNDTPGAAYYWGDHALAFDAQGTLYVVWEDQRSGLNHQTWFASRPAGAAAFGANQRLSDSNYTYNGIDCTLAVDAAGQVHVLYTGLANSHYDLWYLTSTDGGQTWSTPAQVNDDPDQDEAPRLAFDSKGGVHAAWTTFQGDYFTASLAAGSLAFTARTQVNDTQGTVNVGSTAFGAFGDEMYCAWTSTETDPEGDVYFDLNTGAGFGVDLRVNEDGARYQEDPEMAVGATGEILIAWQHYVNGQRYDVYAAVSTDGGQSFRTNFRINDDRTESQMNPSIALGAGNRIAVAWRDDRNNSSFDIYAAEGSLSVTRTASTGSTGGTVTPPAVTPPTPPAVTPPTPPAPTTGTLAITTSGAQGVILINGNVVGVGSYTGNYPAGTYTISFDTVLGYNAPASQTVTVVAGQTYNVNGTYAVPTATTTPPSTGGSTGSTGSTGSGTTTTPIAAPAPLAFVNETMVTPYSGARGSKVAVDKATGHVYTGWKSGGDLWFVKSTDGGLTWSSPVQVNDAYGSVYAYGDYDIAATNFGSIVMVWEDHRNRGSHLYMARSIDGGQSFQANVQVDSVSDNAADCSLAVDAAGEIYLSYRGFDPNGVYSSRYEAWFVRIFELGQYNNLVIEPAVRISDTPEQDDHTRICVGNVGQVFLGWQSFEGDVFVRASTNGGTTWGQPAQVNDVNGKADHGFDMAAWGDTVYVTWGDSRTDYEGDVYFDSAPIGTLAFGADERVNDNTTRYQEYPAIVATGPGQVHVAWQDHRRGNDRFDIYSASTANGGLSWGVSERVNADTTADQRRADLAADAQGKVYCSWQDDVQNPNTLDFDIFVASTN